MLKGNTEGSEANDAASTLRARVRADLQSAMREQQPREIAVLRGLIAAIDNAQAPPTGDRHARYVVHAFGDRSAEVPRVALSRERLRALLEQEIRARRSASDEFARLGKSAEAVAMREEAEIASRYLA